MISSKQILSLTVIRAAYCRGMKRTRAGQLRKEAQRAKRKLRKTMLADLRGKAASAETQVWTIPGRPCSHTPLLPPFDAFPGPACVAR